MNNIIVENGFYIENCTLNELHQKIMDFRHVVQPLCQEKLCKLMAEISASICDHYDAGIDTYCSKSDGLSAFDMGKSMFFDDKTMALLNDSVVEWKMSLLIYPIKTKILGVVHSSRGDWVTKWMDQDFVHPYSYPDKESSKEQKRLDWYSLFKHFDGNSLLNGFVVELTDPRVEDIYAKDIVPYMPSFEDRANSVAESDIISCFGKDQQNPQSFEEFLAWTQSEEGKKEVEKVKEGVRDKLKPELTIEDITRKLNNE